MPADGMAPRFAVGMSWNDPEKKQNKFLVVSFQEICGGFLKGSSGISGCFSRNFSRFSLRRFWNFWWLPFMGTLASPEQDFEVIPN